MSYEQKLMQMKKLLKKTSEPMLPEKVKTIAPPPSYEKEWLKAGLTKEENIHGIVYKRTVHYDIHHKHGDIVLSGLRSTIHEWEKSKLVHPLSPDFSKPLLFFDTETTGLKGAGTLIFLIGLIEQTEDCLYVNAIRTSRTGPRSRIPLCVAIMGKASYARDVQWKKL